MTWIYQKYSDQAKQHHTERDLLIEKLSQDEKDKHFWEKALTLNHHIQDKCGVVTLGRCDFCFLGLTEDDDSLGSSQSVPMITEVPSRNYVSVCSQCQDQLPMQRRMNTFSKVTGSKFNYKRRCGEMLSEYRKLQWLNTGYLITIGAVIGYVGGRLLHKK